MSTPFHRFFPLVQIQQTIVSRPWWPTDQERLRFLILPVNLKNFNPASDLGCLWKQQSKNATSRFNSILWEAVYRTISFQSPFKVLTKNKQFSLPRNAGIILDLPWQIPTLFFLSFNCIFSHTEIQASKRYLIPYILPDITSFLKFHLLSSLCCPKNLL